MTGNVRPVHDEGTQPAPLKKMNVRAAQPIDENTHHNLVLPWIRQGDILQTNIPQTMKYRRSHAASP
jgi:hypothetical protein